MPFRIPHSRVPSGCRIREAFTLLEVILAVAVLAVSLAALGEVLRRGEDNAQESRDLTAAQLVAASKFAELTSGAVMLSPVASAPVPEIISRIPWVYSVESTPTPELGLVAVRVTVSQDPAQIANPIRYSLVRWMPDPLATTTSSSGSASSGGTTGGASGGAASGGTR